ncbi:hypothetical protein JCM1841_000057 [Sporobolomyces salmonicolor]
MAEEASDPLKAYLSKLPEHSTARIQFLYSSLPARKQANPTGYSSALSWWRKTLVDLVQKGLLGEDKLVLQADEALRERLRWDKVGRPTSLGVIISELAQSSDLIPLDTYLSSPVPQGFSVLSLLSRPFWWGLSKVLGSSDLGEAADEAEWTTRKGEWVIPDLVEKAASSLTAKLPDLHADTISRLYTLKSFESKLGALCLPGVTLSERDCRVLAKYLSAKGYCAVDGDVIKFGPPLSTGSAQQTPPITPSDRSTLSLLATLTSLSTYIASIEARIAAEQAQMARYHASKNMGMVKSHLVARKRLEKLLEERVGGRDRVQEVVWAIERATGDEETLSALSLGSATLQQILASPTLQLSNIEATTSALDDALASATEINEAVDSVAPLDSALEDEVDDELKKLVEADRNEEREKERREEEHRVREAERKLKEVEAPNEAEPAEMPARAELAREPAGAQ